MGMVCFIHCYLFMYWYLFLLTKCNTKTNIYHLYRAYKFYKSAGVKMKNFLNCKCINITQDCIKEDIDMHGLLC